MQTCFQLVWMSAERTPNHLAMVDDQSDRAFTYAELIEEIEIVAAGLSARGVVKGTRVATALPGTFDHAIVLLALQRLGAVPALLNFRLTPDDVAGLIKDGDIRGAIVLPDEAVVSAVAEALSDTAMILTVGGGVGVAEDYAACRGERATLGPLPDFEREDEAFIFYTSGTTGLPKGVVLAHKTTEHRVIWLSTQAGLRHGTHLRTLGFMPLSHCIGFYGVFLVTLAMNGTYYVQSAFNPVAANDMIEKHGISYMFAVPQLYFALTQAPNYDPARYGSLDIILYGGGEIPPALLNRIDAEWPCTVRHIYGTTETMNSLYNPDPVGQHTRLRPGYYSRIRMIEMGGSPDDVIKPGREGEMIVDATVDSIFTSYLNRPDATAEKLRDGWYYTGDVCLLHDNGDIDLIGRIDDMVRSGGEHIHPAEVEPVLMAHDAVKDVAVIGIPDEKWGEMLVACVVADGADAAVLDAHMRSGSLAGFKRPKGYLFMDSLPRNAANKVLRRDLKTLAGQARESGDNTKLQFQEI